MTNEPIAVLMQPHAVILILGRRIKILTQSYEIPTFVFNEPPVFHTLVASLSEVQADVDNSCNKEPVTKQQGQSMKTNRS